MQRGFRCTRATDYYLHVSVDRAIRATEFQFNNRVRAPILPQSIKSKERKKKNLASRVFTPDNSHVHRVHSSTLLFKCNTVTVNKLPTSNVAGDRHERRKKKKKGQRRNSPSSGGGIRIYKNTNINALTDRWSFVSEYFLFL